MFSTPKAFRFVISACAVAMAATGMTPLALAQQQGSKESIEEIVTTGTRRSERSASDSAVPIDVIGGQELVNIGTTDLNELLRNTVPSYNVQSHSIDDAATLVRPATLRGLPPDNVLVLVNGKRRHRSAVIAELGSSLNEGSQGADISAIPALAIKQVEVLRDGAAAQYGSDAIAGVLNFVLDDSAEGVTLEARTGEFMEGDGTLLQLSGNAGFALGDNGFLNVTGVWSEQDPTSRSIQRTDAGALATFGDPDQQANVRQPYAQIWGQPETRDNWNIFANMGIQVSDSQEVYAFGNFGRRETEGGFFYRNPNNRAAVYAVDGVRAIADDNFLAGDTDYTSNCPALIAPPGTPSAADALAVAADYAAQQALPANCWLMNQVAPGGFTPQFGGQLKDASIVGGLRGEMANGLSYDFSGGYGRNKVDFFLNNTFNPSLGPDGEVGGSLQRDFDVGSYVQSEVNVNLDFVYPIKVDAFASDLNFAFGAEYRDEIFETIIGETASWEAGRFAFQSGNGSNFYSDGVTPLPDLSIGANGFAGFSPVQAGLFGRSNIAVYADAEADLTDRLTASLAVRYEDFESFGDTTNYKIAARFEVTDRLALRASANTGFRAPTPGQENVTKVSTILVNGELAQSGQIPPTNPIAMALGGSVLSPEESVNYSIGFVWDVMDNLSITADYFNINLEDRIAFTGTIDITDEDPNDYPDLSCPNAKANPLGDLALCLQELGVPGAADLTSVTFYTNDFETTTQGIDVVVSWDTEWGAAGSGNLTAAWNWTETEVESAGNEVSRDKVVDLENQNPEHRGVFTYNHYINDFRFLVRASFYDDWVNSQSDLGDDPTPRGPDGTGYTINCAAPGYNDHCFDGEWIVDLEAAYTFAENYTLAVGADNVLDEAGRDDIFNINGNIGSGNAYTDTTPWGIDGGFWYVRFTANFD